MALVEEGVEAFLRAHRALAAAGSAAQQAQRNKNLAERQQVATHLEWLRAAWCAFQEGGMAADDASVWLQGGCQWRRDAEAWAPEPPGTAAAGDVTQRWLQQRHVLAGFPMWRWGSRKIPIGQEGQAWAQVGMKVVKKLTLPSPSPSGQALTLTSTMSCVRIYHLYHKCVRSSCVENRRTAVCT
jgi:hypothetical protein